MSARKVFWFVLSITSTVWAGALGYYFFSGPKATPKPQPASLSPEKVSVKPSSPLSLSPTPKRTLPLHLGVGAVLEDEIVLKDFNHQGKEIVVAKEDIFKVFKGVLPQALAGKLTDLRVGQELIGKKEADGSFWLYIANP